MLSPVHLFETNMRTPDRRSFDSPRRGTRGRDRNDDFPPSRGRDEPYVPRDAFVPRGGAPAGFGPARAPAATGPETGAIVKWFNAEKGFGFVELEGGGGDAFLHVSVLSRAGYQTVQPGATLRVLVTPGQKGPQIAEVNGVDESTAGAAPPSRSPSSSYGEDRPRPAARAPVDASMAVEMRGTVKWFNAEKGFGFVMPDGGGKDVFVHISALNRGGLSGLEPNQTVKMQVADGRRGPEAVSVEKA